MKILSFELSTTKGSIALMTSEICEQVFLPEPRQQVQQVLPITDNLLKNARLSLKELDGIAYSAGPGSFTGIRLAAGTAQGLALPHQIPLVPISSLCVLAQTAARVLSLQNVFCLNNAFMSEVYAGHYQLDDNGLMRQIEPEQLISPEGLVLPEGFEAIIGDAYLTYADKLPIEFRYESLYPEAIDLAKIATNQPHLFQAPEHLSFNYLRSETAWQKTKPITLDKR